MALMRMAQLDGMTIRKEVTITGESYSVADVSFRLRASSE